MAGGFCTHPLQSTLNFHFLKETEAISSGISLAIHLFVSVSRLLSQSHAIES
jgi:hypothetical protein